MHSSSLLASLHQLFVCFLTLEGRALFSPKKKPHLPHKFLFISSVFTQQNLKTKPCMPGSSLSLKHGVRLCAREAVQLAASQRSSLSPFACLCVWALLINSCVQRCNLTQQMFKSCNLMGDIFWLQHMWDRHFNYTPLWCGFVYKCAAIFENSDSPAFSSNHVV